MFTLDQVRCFVAVAEHLHFGRAAESLSMTQPPLSRQVQKLERSVDVSLIDRDNRSVRLTPAGRQFLKEARKLLALADRAPEQAQLIASGVEGHISMGFTTGSGMSLLGPLVSQLTRRLPGVELSMTEMVTSEQIRAITEGQIDLGVGRPPDHVEPLEAMLLQQDDLVLAVPEGHTLVTSGRPVKVADVDGLPLIMHSQGLARYFYDLVVRYFRIDHSKVVQSLSQMTSMLNLVAADIGIAFVPSSMRKLRMSGVTYVDVVDLPPGIVELRAIWDPESPNEALQRVLETIRSGGLVRGGGTALESRSSIDVAEAKTAQ
ncbi:LysR family transcriptional regulator [Brevibacterium sp.]|uniref:LysR family transcriptional regulator n=1 Tax=Brevibacterium sp. TaxID=1701 RepID=UPI00262015E6|nr:LysR family transcriptional regulator [Brevibacterium sp.]